MNTDPAPAPRVHFAGVLVSALLDAGTVGDSRGVSGDYVQAFGYRYQPPPGRTSDSHILNHPVEVFNDLTESGHAAMYFAAGHRGLSVGDVLAIEDRHDRCGSRGWARLLPIALAHPAPTHRRGTGTPGATVVGIAVPGLWPVTVLADATDQGDTDAVRRNLAHHRPDLASHLSIDPAITHF